MVLTRPTTSLRISTARLGNDKLEEFYMLTLTALAESRDKLGPMALAATVVPLSAYQIHLDPGQVTEAMEQLVARGVACEIPGGPVSYDFTAQLYAHWLRRYRSLSKIVEEVSSELVPE
jgi:hypothetical protein